MKDQIRYGLAALVLVVFALTVMGCGNKRIDNEAMEEEFENAPEWVLTGHEKDLFSAVGSARIGKSGIQFAKTEAMAQARNELARQLSVRVHSLVNTVSRQSGMGDTQTADRIGRQVSEQVADETLNGSRQKDVWISPSSDLYVLVFMDRDEVKRVVRSQVVTRFKEEDAQMFGDEKSGAELDREIDSLF